MRQTSFSLHALALTLALFCACDKLPAAAWRQLSLEEAKRLHGTPEVLFIDGRSMGDWKKGRIPGAIALPTGEFDKRYPPLKSRLRKATSLVVYCQGETCAQADYLAQLLGAKGHKNLAVFKGGFPAWKAAKLPIENGGALINQVPTKTKKSP